VNRTDQTLFTTYEQLWKDGKFLSRYKNFEYPWKAKSPYQKPLFANMLFPNVDKAKVNVSLPMQNTALTIHSILPLNRNHLKILKHLLNYKII